MKAFHRFMAMALAAVMCAGVVADEGVLLEIDPRAVLEILPLAAEAMEIQVRSPTPRLR